MAQDIAQETLVPAWQRSWQLLDNDGSLPGRLVTATRHSAIDRIRSAYARHESPGAEHRETIQDDRADAVPASRTPQEMGAPAIRGRADAVALPRRLSPGYQDVLLHTYLYDRSLLKTARIPRSAMAFVARFPTVCDGAARPAGPGPGESRTPSYRASPELVREPVVREFTRTAAPIEASVLGGRRAVGRGQSSPAAAPETDAVWVTVPGGPTGSVPVRIVRPRGSTAVRPGAHLIRSHLPDAVRAGAGARRGSRSRG
ncbi:hypothetical protein ABT215_18075 [Streptomyces sp900105755]|uniref:hypothetical protein n=1 Tax=Streptomyces sp. 900105755 TaxID=3154389 RepID=UPI0033345D03